MMQPVTIAGNSTPKMKTSAIVVCAASLSAINTI
jgi:hypothetical protein